MPPIFSSLWAPSELEIQIEDDLATIRRRVPNRQQLDFFELRVRQLRNNNRYHIGPVLFFVF
jgi:hypothetical protein